jgi:uncharacterized protein YdeI (YjbR/CyaY-like superfamily)
MKNLLEVKSRAGWRSWLKKNGPIQKEVWLVSYRKASGQARRSHDEAVEDAICFGWIDGKRKKLDDQRFMQRFTPRKPDSRWSAINIERAKKLIAENKMSPHGLAAFHPERKIESHPTDLPGALRKEFQCHAKAWKKFQDFPPYYQRMTIAWVATAKREETQRKRLQQLLESSSENRRIKFM